MLIFIKNIILGQKKRYLLVIMVLTILFGCDFSLLTMIVNISKMLDSIPGIISSIIIMIMILISFVLMMFINNFFIEEKSDEFSIILLSGRNVIQISRYIIIQFGSLFVLSAIFGVCIGSFFVTIMNYIFELLNMTDLFEINFVQVSYYYFFLLIIKLCYIFILDFGKFMNIKFRIVEYMNHVHKDKNQVSFFSSFKVEKENRQFPLVQLSIVLFSLFIIITSFSHIVNIDDMSNLFIYFISALLALVLFVKYSIPLFFDIFHNKILLKQPKLLIATSQLMYLLKAMAPLTLINTILTPMLYFLISMPFSNLYLTEITIVCYFILLIMIFICFIFRFSLYIPKKVRDIATLKAIGFQIKEINYIQCLEIILFNILTVLFPFLIYSIVIYKGYILFSLLGELILLLIGGYFIIYLMIGIYMVIAYFKLTKEVINDVRYLNRSE